jgi:hypothetical protein
MACKLSRKFDVTPAQVEGQVSIGDIVTLVGYGCTQPGGGGADGRKRTGNAEVTGFSSFDIVSRKGAALCFGDSGGPMFQRLFKPSEEPKKIIGVNSKGNIRDTNYNLRLGLEVVQNWLKDFEKAQNVQICGVSKECIKRKPLYCAEERQQFDFLDKRRRTLELELQKCGG